MYDVGVVALFPELVMPVAECGVIGRASERGLLRVRTRSPRELTRDRHRTVDDRPYGGGPGMVMLYEPLRDAIAALSAALPVGVPRVALCARGQRFDEALALDLADAPGMLLVAARYEGMDERVLAHVDLELSLGDYVLSGGELAAAVVIDAVARLLPGVLGHEDSARDDSFVNGLLGAPQYTRPEEIDGRRVPEVLLTGDHARVRRWRLRESLARTAQMRPDLLQGRSLTAEEAALLEELVQEGRVSGTALK
jgi:tRNA (guanine37-N1)-methyltransferase